MTKRIMSVLAAAVTVLMAGAAFAQPRIAGDGHHAPVIEPSIDWWTILYFVVALLGTAVVGFKKSSRTHLD